MSMAQVNGHILCVAASLASYRLADWISDKGTALIARYGVKLVVE